MAVETEPTIQAALNAALRKVRVPETRWASIETYDPLTEQTEVVVDGDSQPTSATNATGTGFGPGQRVLVLHTPPSGAHVIGYRPVPPIDYEPELDGIDVGAGTVDGEYVFSEGGMIDFAVVLVLGAGYSVTDTISVGLPVRGASTVSTIDPWTIGARATIGGGRWSGHGVYDLATPTFATSFASDGMGLWGPGVPDGWSSGSALRVSGAVPRRLPVEDTDE